MARGVELCGAVLVAINNEPARYPKRMRLTPYIDTIQIGLQKMGPTTSHQQMPHFHGKRTHFRELDHQVHCEWTQTGDQKWAPHSSCHTWPHPKSQLEVGAYIEGFALNASTDSAQQNELYPLYCRKGPHDASHRTPKTQAVFFAPKLAEARGRPLR